MSELAELLSVYRKAIGECPELHNSRPDLCESCGGTGRILEPVEETVKRILRQRSDFLDTINAMLVAAGWDGTLEDLNVSGSKPSDYIRSRCGGADAPSPLEDD